MREVAVLGVGMTKFGPSELSLKELFANAALEAISESNLTSRDIQALVIGNVLGDFAEGQMNLAPLLADEIGLGAQVPAIRGEAAGIAEKVNLVQQRLRLGFRGLPGCGHVGGLGVL